MSRGSTPRHAQTAGDLGFAMQFNAVENQKFVYIYQHLFNLLKSFASFQNNNQICILKTVGSSIYCLTGCVKNLQERYIELN